jgi:hypothetical protein
VWHEAEAKRMDLAMVGVHGTKSGFVAVARNRTTAHRKQLIGSEKKSVNEQ